MSSNDPTLSIGGHAVELMRTYCRIASPRAYELWYTFVTGHKPALNESVKEIVALRQTLSADDVDTLFELHVGDGRLGVQTEKTGKGLLGEIDQVMSLIDAALGSSVRYGESLAAITDDLDGPVERDRLRDVLATLVTATRDVASNNQALEGRLRESRGEVENLREMLTHVRQESLTDPLTGIANRKHFETSLTAAVQTAKAERSPLTLVVIDIDNFKRFNDEYGHLTGDQVLRLVGEAMRENVDASSTLARFGGEEFAIILPNTGTEAAWVAAEQIRRNVMGRELLKRSTGESLGRVTVSLGIASIRPGDDATTLLERADVCMYQAKRTGRNRTVTDLEESVAEAAA